MEIPDNIKLVKAYYRGISVWVEEMNCDDYIGIIEPVKWYNRWLLNLNIFIDAILPTSDEGFPILYPVTPTYASEKVRKAIVKKYQIK